MRRIVGIALTLSLCAAALLVSTAASNGRLTAARNVCRPPEQWPITPTLPLELPSPRR